MARAERRQRCVAPSISSTEHVLINIYLCSMTLFAEHNWAPSPKSKIVKHSIGFAVQIQYIVENVNRQTIVQGFNIFSGLNSGPPFHSIFNYPLLKLVATKQWMLAMTYETRKSTLESRNLSLLMAYILYYEKLLDRVVDGKIELLVQWMEIEHSRGGTYLNLELCGS